MTTIHLQKTIQITAEFVFQKNLLLKVTKRELKQLLILLHQVPIYHQVDRVLMGPILANLFMGYHEEEWLQQFNKGKVFICKRYVDEIFCMSRK